MRMTILVPLCLTFWTAPVIAQNAMPAESANRFIDAASERYAQGVVTPRGSETLYIGGQVGLTAGGVMSPDFVAQAEAVFANMKLVLEAAGYTPGDLVEMTYYVVAGPERMDQAYWSQIFTIRDRVLGPVRATGALVYVPALYRPEALIEVSAVAAKRQVP